MTTSATSTSPKPTAQKPQSALVLPEALRRELDTYVTEGHPHEVCGLLIGIRVGQSTAVERVMQARNLNRERAHDRYELDPEDFLAADRAAQEAGLDIVGIWHSHPDCPAEPSKTDLDAAWQGYSYLIVTATASGITSWRSWRLDPEGTFYEEDLSS